MENPEITILHDPRVKVLTKSLKVILVLDEEAKRHARVQVAHVDRPWLLHAVVQLLLLPEVLVEINLTVNIVRVQQDQSVRLIFLFIHFSFGANVWVEALRVIYVSLATFNWLLKMAHKVIGKVGFATD